MPDLTDSFCERCGTRYAFAAKSPGGSHLQGARVLVRGLKDFVLSDGQSMREALALARLEEDHEESTRLSEAFHRIFNFCLTCRQYACYRCWNPEAGACLSCTPRSELSPAALEAHPRARPSITRSPDRPISPTGPAPQGALDPALRQHFDPLVHPAEQRPGRGLEDSALPAWPSADLPAGSTPRGAARAGNVRPLPDGTIETEAGSLWPIADEMAPEMTLTPEELELVEAHLRGGDAVREPAAEPEAPAPGTPLVEDVARPADRSEDLVKAEVPSGPAMEPEAAVIADGTALATPGVLGPALPEPAVEVLPQRTPSSPTTMPPPLGGRQAPQPEAGRHRPILARLFGRRTSPPETPTAATPRPAPRLPGEPQTDEWPIATRWVDRPAATRNRRHEADRATVDAGSVDPAAAQPAPEVTSAWAPAPAELELEHADFGLEVPVSASLHATEPEPPARTDADREALESPSRGSLRAVDRDHTGQPVAQTEVGPTPAASPGPAAPALSPRPPLGASWPPLGASWRAHDGSTGSSGPEAPPVLPVAAARPDWAPPMTELWVQSAERVLNQGSARVCRGCALPLSAQARYCRRCGTDQA
ncbi:MAG: hypothetical protein ABSG37_01675 [Candidatus Limnocylindrales bacterium]|jgi:hypothetical protein